MISLYDLLDASQGQLFGEPGPHLFADFCVDVNQVPPNSLFVALKTDQSDGYHAMEAAVDAGATGLLCSRPPDFDTDGLSVILVKDPLKALMEWSHFILGKLGTQVIAVTGTTGKAIAVEAISLVLSTQYKVVKPLHYDTGRLSVPMTLARLTPEDQFVVIGLDIDTSGEMAQMVQALRPRVGVVTFISEFIGVRFNEIDEYIAEIGLLLDYLSPDDLAVLNNDDDHSRSLLHRSRSLVKTVGIENFGADVIAFNLIQGLNRTGFDLRMNEQRYLGRWMPLSGQHLLYSALNAILVGDFLDVPVENALKALTELQSPPGQMRLFNGRNGALIVDDTYKANPESTLQALDWLESVREPEQRVTLVLGDMDAFGSAMLRGHRMIGQRSADVADRLVTQGATAALAGRAALDQGMMSNQVAISYSLEDTLAYFTAPNALMENDLILVKGGVQSHMESVVRALLADPEDTQHLVRKYHLQSPQSFRPNRASWVSVDIDALSKNVRAIKQHIGTHVTLFAVLKADAYGHGAVNTARVALANGADHLAVASVNEAMVLREAGITAPILVMGYTSPEQIRLVVQHNLTITLYDLDLTRVFNHMAQEMHGQIRAHVKIDSGMGRMGVLPAQVIPFFRQLSTYKAIEIEGVYTHFSSADGDPEYTAYQAQVFQETLIPLQAAGYQFKFIHAANSAATLAFPEYHFNAVRVGIALYGLSPSEKVQVFPEMQPVLSWKTQIAQVKILPDNHPIGYGNTYLTSGVEKVALIPVGYADGMRRAPNAWNQVLLHGKYAPIVGRISMEKTMINISHIPDVNVGDEVILLGRQGDLEISADDIARRWGTINYEVVCSILPRIPR